MKDENLIHIRLDYTEAVLSKVDILSTQMNLIKMLRTMKAFHKLRSEELRTKAKIDNGLRSLKAKIHKLETLLPKIKIPKILQHEELEEEEIEEEKEGIKKGVKKKKEKDAHEKDLEEQLMEIQEKLRKLQ